MFRYFSAQKKHVNLARVYNADADQSVDLMSQMITLRIVILLATPHWGQVIRQSLSIKNGLLINDCAVPILLVLYF